MLSPGHSLATDLQESVEPVPLAKVSTEFIQRKAVRSRLGGKFINVSSNLNHPTEAQPNYSPASLMQLFEIAKTTPAN